MGREYLVTSAPLWSCPETRGGLGAAEADGLAVTVDAGVMGWESGRAVARPAKLGECLGGGEE